MQKKTAPIGLLMLLGLAQTAAMAKKEMNPNVKKQEIDQLRLMYLASHHAPEHGIQARPRGPLHTPFLIDNESVTLVQVQKAHALAQTDEAQVNALYRKRDAGLAGKYPVYRELLQLQSKLDRFRKEHELELKEVFYDRMYRDAIETAETKASLAWGTYWNLQWEYNRMHWHFHGPERIEFVPMDMQQMEKDSVHYTLKPGTILTDTTNPSLPPLHSSNGTFAPQRVFDYMLHSCDGKKIPATLTRKDVSDGINMPGHSSDTYYYRLALDKHVSSGTFCVVAKHVDGNKSVLFTVVVSKKGSMKPQATPKNSHKAGRHTAQTR